LPCRSAMLKYKCRPTIRDRIDTMASAVLTISQAVETSSENRTTDPNRDEQLAAPYQLYMQCRQRRQRQPYRCCHPRVVFNLCRGVLARLLLILLAIYLYLTAYCIDEQQNRVMLYLSFSLIFIIAEGTIAIWYKNGEHEWYWYVLFPVNSTFPSSIGPSVEAFLWIDQIHMRRVLENIFVLHVTRTQKWSTAT
jgi:hypothetical protein